ncbi:excisionase [Rhodococcus sp. CUA-806]|nr:excisionase [Rhodococcus sp. CUA-806]
MNKVMRATLISAVVITTVIGIASFVLSFAALWDLATMAGVPRTLSWLWPVIVDGTILQATISVIALAHLDRHHSGRRFFWAVLIIAALVSIGANALHAFISQSGTLHPALSAAIATVAPVSLLAATHGLGILVRVPTVRMADTAPESAGQDPALPEQALPDRALPEPALPVIGPPLVPAERAVDLKSGAPEDPLEDVDRWILDEDRAEDLFPVEAP